MNAGTQLPFFIVGCGRSGTTLLRVILNSHPSIAIPLESLFIIDYLRARAHVPVSTMRELIVKEYEISEWGLRLAEEDLQECSTAKELIDKVHELYVRQHGKQTWGQKTPRFVRFGKLLKTIYPNGRFIHLIRDPRAVVSSLIRSKSHCSNAYFGTQRWVRDVQAGLNLQSEYPNDVLEIRYETLVSSPQQVLEQICTFIGIEFDPVMLSYYSNESEEYQHYHNVSKVEQPLDVSRINAWEEHLTREQVMLIEGLSKGLMQQLGYNLHTKQPTINRLQVLSLKLERLVGLTQQLVYYLKYRPGYILSLLRRKYILSLPLIDLMEM